LGKWSGVSFRSEQKLSQVDLNSDIETVNEGIRGAIIGSARQVIPMGTGGRKSNTAPWWSEECREAVKSRNSAFRMLHKQ
jgi:hypothetical protein